MVLLYLRGLRWRFGEHTSRLRRLVSCRTKARDTKSVIESAERREVSILPHLTADEVSSAGFFRTPSLLPWVLQSGAILLMVLLAAVVTAVEIRFVSGETRLVLI